MTLHRPEGDERRGDEFYGFGGPDAKGGLAAHREEREPRLSGPTSE